MLHLNIHGFVSFHGTLVRELLRSALSLDFICHLAWICECAAHSGDIKSRFFSSLGMVSTTFVFCWCRSNTHYLSEFMTTFFRVELECQYLHILLYSGNSYLKYDWKLDSNCQFCRTTTNIILQWMSRLSSSMLSVLLVFHRSFVDAVLRWFTWAIPVWALFSVSLFVLELF